MLTTTAEFEICRNIKETKCYVSTNPVNEEKEYVSVQDKQTFTLPDGNEINVSYSYFILETSDCSSKA